MVQEEKPNEQDKKIPLVDLPVSSDPYWEYSEKFSGTPQEIHPNCQHYFLQVRSNEAKCKFCNWGLFLSINDRVELGHIYNLEKKII